MKSGWGVTPPKFVVVGMLEHGPQVWSFETAHEVAGFMWGRFVRHYAIFKNRVNVPLQVEDVLDLELALEKFGEDEPPA